MTKTKIAVPATLAVLLAAPPAFAHKPEDPGAKGKAKSEQEKAERDVRKGERDERKAQKREQQQAKRCAAKKVGYVAHGTVSTAALTKNADGTYDGTLAVAVTKTNKHGRKHDDTTQTYTLDDAKVRFNGTDTNADGKVDEADVKAGDRVTVSGKITRVHKKCATASTFEPAVTIKRVTLKAPKAAEAPKS